MTLDINDLDGLVRAKIENLRPKLLDLSRRNPLLSTKLGPRSNAHIRAVDELPDVLFYKLTNAEEMTFIALPAIDEDPRDEQVRTFRDALSNARLTDEQYVAAMEAVDGDADDYLDKSRSIERALKDRVRQQLGLAPRVQKTEINLTQHAKNNGIVPSYELPKANDAVSDGRHNDECIQTLLLPSDLERKLNAIQSKSRTWVQETGMNVLQMAFGFLEWRDDSQAESAFAPLVLLPVDLTKARTTQGARFSVLGSGDEPELNAVLNEKLRIDFAISLPEFGGSSLEEYLENVGRALPKGKNWRVRRQVAIGVFPSARMAMYHDLDPTQPTFPNNEIVQSLLAGSDSAGATPFADEYNIDEPHIESKVPWLVMDADSSQFSALVDISNGKNLAIEGPPGTGKSQTIVNAIAAALGEGKKVLFVAEKLAALNVVKARLEAVGLGEFLLPLQAEKSTREQVMDSLRARLEMRDTRAVRDYEEKIEEFQRIRKQLASYIDLIKTEFGESGLTVHEILGKSIATNDRLTGVPIEAIEGCALSAEMMTRNALSALLHLGSQIEKSHAETQAAKAYWRDTKLVHPDRFTVEEICALADRAANGAAALAEAREGLTRWMIDKSTVPDELQKLSQALGECADHGAHHPKTVIAALLAEGKATELAAFLKQCDTAASTAESLAKILSVEPHTAVLAKIQKIEEICARAALSTLSGTELNEQLDEKRKSASTMRAILSALGPLVAARPTATTWLLDDLAQARLLYRDIGREPMLLRSNLLQGDNATYHLGRLSEEGLDLQARRDSLSEHLSSTGDVPTELLAECVSILRTSGTFSFLSPSYRRAKRLFSSISRASKFSRNSAIGVLTDLIAFHRATAEFLRQSESGALFGMHFRGLETRFDLFVRLTQYLNRVSENFGAADKAEFGAFLRDAPITQLDLLPALKTTGLPITFESLTKRLANVENEIQGLEAAIRELRGLTDVFNNPDLGPPAVTEARQRLELLLSLRSDLDNYDIGREILQERFEGSRTNYRAFESVVGWARSIHSLREALVSTLLQGDPSEAKQTTDLVLAAEARLSTVLTQLSEKAQIDTAACFLKGKTLAEAALLLKSASQDSEGLFAFSSFASSLLDAPRHGVMPLVEERLRGGSVVGLGAQVEAVAIRQLAKEVYTKLGSKLSRFKGTRLDELRSALAEKDKEIIQLSRRHLRAKLKAGARPPIGNGIGRKSTWTDMALIENEISKKQRFISVRDLTQRAGRALAELKPCWMMSPLAVAQYIPKSSVKFDLCIIDEASQMPPESAIGALLRSNQAVVVGDTNQLPPSNFFKTVIDDEDTDEDEAVLNESVLEMANGAFRPGRRLRWHYRSRHSGLIKFSNRLVYDDQLIVFPSATESLARMGVEFRSVAGRYKAGTNPIEAKAIIDSVIEFMTADPDRSLGVVTLNQKQRDLILEELEYAATNNLAVQKYIDTWRERNDGLEEFFIKNLENVQGDERDVIFIGTVYGAEEPGARVMQRFGPINGLAGRRRLNVLFTRAKQKIVTFSSMSAADIVAEEHTNAGAYMLKRWLEYSASGILDTGHQTYKEPDSDFEVFVIDQIKAMGCMPVPQVGVAGYFVDIGIRHDDWPHGFILGVECDGASYHSAKSARDRDRLRQEILEGLGWQLHRIWSTDWFNNPRQEAERLRKVIAERMAILKAREHEFVVPAATKQDAPITEPAATVDSVEPEQPETEVAVTLLPQQATAHRIEVGDTVRVRYLTDDKKTVQITISDAKSDPSQGVVHHKTPVASALLGAEEDDEVEILVGSYIRPAVIEHIRKKASQSIQDSSQPSQDSGSALN